MTVVVPSAGKIAVGPHRGPPNSGVRGGFPEGD